MQLRIGNDDFKWIGTPVLTLSLSSHPRAL
jgi:hypothetical protein